MMRLLLGILFSLALSAIAAAQVGISSFFPGPGMPGATAYVGPCDLTTCAEAYSVTRDMTINYTGNLFQLTRYSDNTTLNVGTTAHVANLSGVESFCANTTCVYTKIYSQITGGSDLSAVSVVQGVVPSVCTTATACAPPFYIDPGTGLPIVPTMYPTEMYNSTADANVTGGSHATSVFIYGRNEKFSQCCGLFGPAHAYTAPDTAGTDFLPALGFSNGHTYVNCATATTNCSMTDIEIYATNGADYSPTANQDVALMHVFTGGSSTNLINVYVNSATAIYSGAPASSTTMNIGNYIRLGAGGDGSHVGTVFREGLITNSALAPADFTNINNNISSFYSAQSPNACRSTGDFSYYNNGNDGLDTTDYSVGSTLSGYALRRMSASYFGPIADLRDSEATPVTHTYGPASSGCGMDPAAATFCSANPPCHISKLYYQGTYSTQGIGNVHDTLLDLVQTTLATQPTVDFTGLNGVPTMAFNGSQTLCSATLGSVTTTFMTVLGAVAKRTANTTSYSAILNAGGNNSSFGFANVSGQIYGFVGYGSTPVIIAGGSLTEGAWHSVIWEWAGGGTNQTSIYGDGSSVASVTQANNPIIADGSTASDPVCIGSLGNSSDFLTGEIAEAIIGTNSNAGVPASVASTVFTLQQIPWGPL